jgi:hypothetical protein
MFCRKMSSLAKTSLVALHVTSSNSSNLGGYRWFWLLLTSRGIFWRYKTSYTAFVWVVAGVGLSFGTLPLLVLVALLPPREQAYENSSSITLISFRIGHCWGPKMMISIPWSRVRWYRSEIKPIFSTASMGKHTSTWKWKLYVVASW